MRSTDRRALLAAVPLLALAACSPPPRREAPGDAPGSPTPPAAPPTPAERGERPVPDPRDPAPVRPAGLPAARPNRDLAALKRQAADRILAANPSLAHKGPIQEPLLAIPVLEIELERDGAIRRIEVLRHPKQARDTTELAIAAVRRAAPFGDVSALRRPWKFAETFLFGDDRRFKLRTHHE